MIIGRFEFDRAADCFKGDIVCLTFQLYDVEIAPKPGLSPRRPDYAVTPPTGHGRVEIGSAWKRKSERGTPYLSVALDAPMLAEPLHAALFMDVEGAGATLVWSRVPSRTAPALAA